MRALLVIFFALFFQFNLVSQTIIVVDKTSLQPIENVVIRTTDFKISFLTNTKGKTVITKIRASDSLRIEKLGYHSISVLFGEVNRKDFKIFMSQKSHELNEVVVSVNKFEEKRSNLPQQIEVLKSQDIAHLNQPTTADVLQNTGNITIQKSQLGGGSPIMRGFEANKVLLVLDGVRMNNAIYRGGHLQNILSIDNTILERTEIVFGPGSTVYGSDALGGVVHFYTKNPKLAGNSEKVFVNANSFLRYSTAASEKTAHADFNIGFKKIGFLTSVTYTDFDDLRQGSIRKGENGDWGKRALFYKRINNRDSALVNKDINIQRGSGYSQVDLLQKVLLRQNENTDHILNLQYSVTSNVPRYDRLTESSAPGKLKFAEWYYGPQARFLASYIFTHASHTLLFDNFKVTTAYQNIGESRNDRQFGKNKLQQRIEKLDIGTINIDFLKEIKKHELRYGFEYAINKVNSTARSTNILNNETTPLDTRYPDGGSTFRTAAGYLSHSWKISPKVIISDGLRYSHIRLQSLFNDTTFFNFSFRKVTQKSSAVNGNVGLVYLPNESTKFSVIGSTGFRAPNVDDMAKVFESVPGSVIVPNPTLRPEYTYNGEVSVAKWLFNKVQVGGTFYYTLYDNAITTQNFKYQEKDSIFYEGKLSRVTASVNAGEAYLYGYNLNIAADLTNTLSLTSTFNYTFGRIKTDSVDYPLDHIPPFYGKTSLYLKMKQFKGEVFVMYNGWKKLKEYNLIGEDNIKYATERGTPAWYTLNIRGAWQIKNYLQLQLALENILDRNYRVFGSGISAAGRNLSVTLRVSNLGKG